MLITRIAIGAATNPCAAEQRRELSGYLVGIPFLLAAATPLVVFQSGSVLAGFVLAMLAFFTVQLPVAAALLKPSGSEDTEFPLSPRVYLALLTVWTVTVWLASAANG